MTTPESSSLVLTKSRDSLTDAIDEFQATLRDEERHQLRQMGTVPDADSIMVFTAELDSIQRQRTGPSYASRLHTVLSSVGVFCGVVDTFVSAHPEISALIWGGVKLTMVVAANVASYH
ncbi:ankyrin repeat-containing domain protein [Apiospora arundinis]|uniref:Ankyrin repeat-containing domain protein n=1 Tax=Apiospora arundinis TaxID=335852 RepID=A0ABR2JI97_9PEZI